MMFHQVRDTGLIVPSTDAVTPEAWQRSHCGTSFMLLVYLIWGKQGGGGGGGGEAIFLSATLEVDT